MLDSVFGAIVDFIFHLLFYRFGEIVLRVLSFGRLKKKFFDEYTYLTIFVGILSLSILGFVIWWWLR